MTSDLRIQGEVVVNSEQAESAFNRVGDKAQQMANEVATSAGKAGQAVDKIGDGAGASAEKFTRAESRISASIKRATNELELLGKTASQRLEFNISDKGLDPKKFEPMLQRLREVEAQAQQAQRAATGSLDKMGISAAQTAAALRGVPAQFTDIVTSLKGGQAPLTVFLQQGGQLKDMFGGAGNAARALGGYVVGLVNPFTIAAAAVAGLGFAMYSLNGKDAALRDLSAQLIGTGRASAAAVGDIKALVNELNTVPGVSKAAATAIIGEFAKVSGLGSSLFKGLGSSVADFAAATGTDLPTAAKKLAEAFADPAKGAKSLEDSLGTLTAAQILTITKMAEMGDKSGAQAALLDALKQATEGLAKQGMTPLGEATDKMSNAWDKLTTSVGNSSAFRTANDWLAKLIEKTAELTERLSQMQPPTWLKFLPVVGPAIGAASLLAGPEANAGGSRSVSGMVGNMEGGATGSWGPTADDIEKQVKAALDLTRSYESQSAAMEKLRGVAKVANDALKALEAQSRGNSVEAKELRERIAGVNEKLAEMAKKGGAAQELTAYESLVASIRTKIAANEAEIQGGGRLTESDRLRIKLQEELDAGSKKLTASHKARALALLDVLSAQEKEEARIKGMVAAYKEEAETAEELARAYVEQSKAREAGRADVTSYAAGIQESNDALQFELSLIGMSEQARNTALEQYRIELALKKQIAAIDANGGFDEAQREEERARARAAAATAKANAANRAFLDDWKRASEQINSTLTDALMRGFESGKDFAKNLRDTVVNMFKTMVLRPVISAVLSPISGGIQGMMGGMAGGGAGGANILSTVQTGFSALNGSISSTIGSAFSKFAGSSVGQSLGLSNTTYAAGPMGPVAPGTELTATGQSLGSALGVVGNTLAGYALGSMARSLISGGYSVGKGMDTFQKVGVAVGSAIGGPVMGAIIGAAAGVVNRVFGRKLKDSGIQGTFGGQSGFEGESFEFYKGGLLRSDKTKTNPLAEEVRKTLGDAFGAMRVEVGTFATLLGLETDRLAGFTTSLKISTKGLDDKAAQEKIQEALATANNELAEQVIGSWQRTVETISRSVSTNIGGSEGGDFITTTYDEVVTKSSYTASEFARTGEKAIDTLRRLATSFSTVNETADALGYGMADASIAAAAAASNIVDAFGGLEAFTKTLGSYFSNFYSDTEQKAATARQVSRALGEFGLEIDPSVLQNATRPAIRAFVESVGEQFGYESKEYVAAIQQANVLAGITEALPSTVQAIDTAAQSASDAAQDAARAWQDITDALLGARSDAEIELLRAQGKEEAALAAERARSIVGYDAYQVSLYDGTQAILSQVTALEKQAEATKLAQERAAELASTLAGELPGVLDKFLSPDQRLTAGYTGIASDLSKVGINVNAGALATASLDQIAAAAMAVYNLGSTSDETRLALVRAVSGIKDLRDAALDLQATAARTAATAAGNALGARNNAGSLLDRIDGATGGKGDAYSRTREAELWTAMQTASYQQQIELSGELTGLILDRYQVEKDAARQQLDYAKQLKDYVSSLSIGSLSPKTMGEKLAEAGRQYQDTLGLAQGGDKDAQGRLQGASNAYLELARQYYASSGDYTAIFESVTGSLSGLGDSLMTDSERQLSVSSASLDELKNLRGVLEGAYATAQQDYLAQQSLLSGQLAALQSIEGGTAAARDIVQGLPALLAAQLQQQSQAAAGAIDAALTKPLAIQPYGADMPATIVTPAPIDWSGYQQGNDALVAEVKALREEVKQLREERKAHDQVIVQGTVAVAEEHARRIVDGVGSAVQQGIYQASLSKEAAYK